MFGRRFASPHFRRNSPGQTGLCTVFFTGLMAKRPPKTQYVAVSGWGEHKILWFVRRNFCTHFCTRFLFTPFFPARRPLRPNLRPRSRARGRAPSRTRARTTAHRPPETQRCSYNVLFATVKRFLRRPFRGRARRQPVSVSRSAIHSLMSDCRGARGGNRASRSSASTTRAGKSPSGNRC